MSKRGIVTRGQAFGPSGAWARRRRLNAKAPNRGGYLVRNWIDLGEYSIPPQKGAAYETASAQIFASWFWPGAISLGTGSYSLSGNLLSKKQSIGGVQTAAFNLNLSSGGVSPVARSFGGTSADEAVAGLIGYTITAPYSFSAWVQNNVTAAGIRAVIDIAQASGNNEVYLRCGGAVANTLEFGFWNGSVDHRVVFNAAMSTGVWYRATGTYDGATYKIYVNSTGQTPTLVSSTDTSGPNFAPSSGDSAVGWQAQSNSRWWNGTIADVAIWNIALSSAQAAQLGGTLRAWEIGSTTHLLSYWPILGQSPEPDESTTAQNLTITGTTVVTGPPIDSFTPLSALGNETLKKGSQSKGLTAAFSLVGEQLTEKKTSIDMPQSGFYALTPDSQLNINKGSLVKLNAGFYAVNSVAGVGRSFNGTSDYIQTAGPIGVTPFTMACWVNVSITSTQESPAFTAFDTLTASPNEWARFSYRGDNTKHLEFLSLGDGHGDSMDSGSVFPLGSWHHIAATQTSTGKALYIDGVQVATGLAATQVSTGAAAFLGALANNSSSPNIFFPGSVADAAIWNIGLSTTDLTNLAAGVRAGNVESTSLIGWWPITGASPEPDASGFGNNGVVTGTSVVSPPPTLGAIPGLGALTLTLSTTVAFSMSIGTGVYALTGENVTLLKASQDGIQAVTYALTGENEKLLKASKDFPQTGSYTLTGENLTLEANHRATLQVGNYTLTGEQIKELATHFVAAQAGFYSLTGENEKLLKGAKAFEQAGFYVITGENETLVKKSTITPQTGFYSLTDEALRLLKTSAASLQTGFYNVTGEQVTLTAAHLQTVQTVFYNFTPISLVFSASGQTTFNINLGTGTYTLSGENLTLLKTSQDGIQVGLYKLTGEQLATLKGSMTKPQAGFYTLNGENLTLTAAHVEHVQTGFYSLTDAALTLLRGAKAFVSSGFYTLTGENETLKKTSTLTAQTAIYSLSDEQLTLLKASKMTAQTVSYTLTVENEKLLRAAKLGTQTGFYNLIVESLNLSAFQQFVMSLGAGFYALNVESITLTVAGAQFVIIAHPMLLGEDGVALRGAQPAASQLQGEKGASLRGDKNQANPALTGNDETVVVSTSLRGKLN